MGKLNSKLISRLPVDSNKWGVNCNTYSSPPEYYYDIEFACKCCGKKDVWTAENQKYWFEKLGKNINTTATKCSICRAHENALKEEQRRHMNANKNEKL